ncbi:RHS repeat-associated core domain-containing protein [Mesonia aestuariivivens]|uniref:Hint domain-containing protein n=1 Tax=Mesonia aestuariivivens TaxID=2796128 RepID=A0ABS6W2N3_9FLAO|nr:RHS repeat-associated core domain-containing protein [Mesonia aestuariivivens]MBW2962110.1 hypothetical protein [Mesonia aestuariivivens]
MFVEEHKNSNNSPYKFNAKELDEETGNYYYGARYYDPKWSIWLSVDPLAEQFPGWSPYAYVHNNPINMIDPDGRSADWVDNGDGTWTAEAGDSAYSLAQDAGISMEEANSIVESQLGDNYIRESDGMLMSDVEIGDEVRVSNPTTVNSLSSNSELSSSNYEFSGSSSLSNDNASSLNNLNTSLSVAGYAKLGQEALVKGLINSKDLAPAVSSYFKIGGYGLGALSMGVNAVQIENAVKSNNKQATKKASAELTANGFMTYGGPIGLGVGLGAHISLFLNPTMANPETPKDYSYQNHCFVAGTKVTMSDGQQKNIEDIKVGDEILSLNMETMKVESDQVIELPNKFHIQRMIYMELDNNLEVISSPNHPFYVKSKGWSTHTTHGNNSYAKLEIGDTLFYYENGKIKETKIIKIIDEKKEAPMYNIKHVQNNNTFFVNGVLVHNKYKTEK